MKKSVIFFIGMLIFFSCATDGPGLPPLSATYLLLNSDSSSVITSSKDKVIVDYRDEQDGMIRRSYTVRVEAIPTDESNPWIVEGSFYTLDWRYVGGDSLFITCKERTDTLVEVSLDPLEIFFNGKRTYKPVYKGELIPLVR